VKEFAERYPVSAIVGVDDDTTVLAAQLAEALVCRHNAVEAVQSGALSRKLCGWRWARLRILSPPFWILATDQDRVGSPSRPAIHVSSSRCHWPQRGVIRADNAQAFAKAFEEIVSILA